MTSPKLATTKRSGSRFYEWRGDKYWSVTTILSGGIPKPALVNWAKKFTAEVAYDSIDILNAMHAKGDRDGAIDWLKNAAFRDRDRKADLGTLIHAATEAYVLGKPFPKVPEMAEPRMVAFRKFLEDWKPQYVATEASVFNRTARYAGTLDAIAMVGNRMLLLDMKTGKAVYPEVALQLAAYRYAEFIGGADGKEEPLGKVDGAAVLHLPDEGESYELVDVRADEEVFRFFRYVIEVYRWQLEFGKSCIRGPLEIEKEEAAA